MLIGSQTGGKSASIAHTLIENTKLNGAHTLARVPDPKINRVDDQLLWNTPLP